VEEPERQPEQRDDAGLVVQVDPDALWTMVEEEADTSRV
jgi:hypothetical protein